ncbi:hypothetical protein RRF57_002427 [Xylaria bambusicola]|uniref:Uncharacterized protein n=1 Tax=Xylaria bambusicola TaxID=326684 RepID=A0AAN7UFA1_9PEZI
MLKSYEFDVRLHATTVHKPGAPELLDGKATDCTSYILSYTLESHAQNRPLIVNEARLKSHGKFYLDACRETPPESTIEPLTVHIDGLDLLHPDTWRSEPGDSRDE